MLGGEPPPPLNVEAIPCLPPRLHPPSSPMATPGVRAFCAASQPPRHRWDRGRRERKPLSTVTHPLRDPGHGVLLGAMVPLQAVTGDAITRVAAAQWGGGGIHHMPAARLSV